MPLLLGEGLSVRSIGILGCGNVGSRHLQALLKLATPHDIHVYDPSSESLARARERADEVHHKDKTLYWHTDCSSLPGSIDLVIIASLSIGRVPLVELALSRGSRHLLLEKIVCQSLAEYDRIVELCNTYGARAWVNLASRYFKGYEWLKGDMSSAGKVSLLAAYGGNHGLACSGIHLLDIFSFLSGAGHLEILAARLDRELHPSRRGQGLIDFSGRIDGKVGECEFSISFVSNHRASVVMIIEAEKSRYIVDDMQDYGLKASKEREWRWENFLFKPNLVSETTTWIVADILKEGSCKLPTLAESRCYHAELFRVLNKHLENVTGRKVDLCPVT